MEAENLVAKLMAFIELHGKGCWEKTNLAKDVCMTLQNAKQFEDGLGATLGLIKERFPLIY